VQRALGILASLLLGVSIMGNISSSIYGSAEPQKNNINQQKVVILTFDDGYKSQYSNAKPILDKYGFKATFSIVCNYVGSGDNRMTWKEIKSLQQEGHNIASHTMNHYDLSKLPPQEVEYEVAQSKQCLLDQGINPKSFAYPFNGGSDDPSVISTVANYYDLARTATDPLAFLSCDSSDCTANRYSIMGWSHDSEKKNNAYNDQQMLERFVQVVNSQNEYNANGVNVVPILIWHKIDNSNKEYSTSIDLFEAEVKYLYDNGFIVLTMADLVYDGASKYLKISGGNDGAPIKNQIDFAARVADVEEDTALSTEEQLATTDAESAGEDDTVGEEETPTASDYDTISDRDETKRVEPTPNSQSSFNDDEADETGSRLPSAILQFLNEP
jgi:peptidoglycan/xylan/chitin deacetylase (PgdA/CDA1 family)